MKGFAYLFHSGHPFVAVVAILLAALAFYAIVKFDEWRVVGFWRGIWK